MTERSADVLDLAAQRQEELNDAGRAAVAQALKSQQPEGFDGNCIEEDCGEPLPPIRIEMGRVRCTSCQVRVEAEAKRRGR